VCGIIYWLDDSTSSRILTWCNKRSLNSIHTPVYSHANIVSLPKTICSLHGHIDSPDRVRLDYWTQNSYELLKCMNTHSNPVSALVLLMGLFLATHLDTHHPHVSFQVRDGTTLGMSTLEMRESIGKIKVVIENDWKEKRAVHPFLFLFVLFKL
jgi:hypothetical protein